jgi:hypothetical protein
MKHEYIVSIRYSRKTSAKDSPELKHVYSVIATSYKEAEKKAKEHLMRFHKEEDFFLEMNTHRSRRIWD